MVLGSGGEEEQERQTDRERQGEREGQADEPTKEDQRNRCDAVLKTKACYGQTSEHRLHRKTL